MASGHKSGCGIGWASGGQSQGYICDKLRVVGECSRVMDVNGAW